MFKVFVGGISPEGEHLLTTYLNVFMPDAVIEPLKAVGIKGKMKNHAKRQDVALVIIDESLYQACVGVADDVLALPKVHKYVDDDGLNQFLISKFGRLDGVDTQESAVIPPDMLMQNEEPAEEDSYIPKSNDFLTTPDSPTVPPEQLEQVDTGVIHSVQEDEYDNLAVAPEEVTSEESNNALIDELQEKLSRSEMMVRNLTLQLEDKTSGSDDDIAAFVARIRELEEENEKLKSQSVSSEEDNYINLGKIAKAEQVIGEFNDLKAQIKKANEDKSALEYDKTNLTGQVELLNGQIEELKNKLAEIDILREDIASRDAQIESLTTEVSSKSSEIDDKVSEIEQLKAEIGVLQDEVTSDKEKLSGLDELSTELSNKKLELDNMQVDLDSKQKELDTANAEIEKLKSELSTKVNELTSKESEITEALEMSTSSDSKVTELESTVKELREKIEELQNEISSKNSEIETMQQAEEKLRSDISTANEEASSQIKVLNTTISEKDSTIESLTAKVNELTDEIAKKEELIETTNSQLSDSSSSLSEQKDLVSSLNAQIEELKGKVEDLNKQLEAKTKEISSLEEASALANDTSEVQAQAIDKALKEKQEIEDKLVESETAKFELESKVKELEADIEVLNAKCESYDSSINLVSAEKEKLENQVAQLQADLIKAKSDEENVSRLENELLEERRKSARLTSEVEVLKKTDDSSKTSELRVEIARLKNELEQVKSANADSNAEELERLKSELDSEKELRTSLELDIVDLNDQISELSESVFAQMQNVAMPKVPYDITLPVPVGVGENFYCVASGSEESTSSVYQTLRKACVADSSKRILIIDLVTDSSIDREFGISKVVSPINWLNGAESFKSYIASTKYPNVKVLSTALAYLNDLFLLSVDWQKKLNDLGAFNADVVVINIGCLNNTVTKVLFNMFSHCMKSYVITKATPVNLRTVILNLTGLKNLSPNVSVECVNFDDKASRGMYERLTAKYKAHIIQASDTLKL